MTDQHHNTNKIWETAQPITKEAEKALADIPAGSRQLLFNRNIYTFEEAHRYLEAEGPLHDPFLLDGMEIAVERINAAISDRESIVIYGDYDVDGVSATSLLVKVLTRLDAKVRHYIPDRFDEGYGLSIHALESLAQEGVRLVISVDCGIRASNEVQHANQHGLDVIITDHHHPRAELPPALTIINPKKPGDLYPEKNLAGVGVAFKIAQAILQQNPRFEIDANEFLDLVALGTVADIVPLTGENRSMVKSGIKLINAGSNLGLSALANAARLNPTKISARDIGFMLGPRLNAAGRLESAVKAFELLVTADAHQASLIAQELDDLNRKRQNIVGELVNIARDEIETLEDQPDIILSFNSRYEQGVVGLVASRLVEDFYRPAVVGQDKGDEIVASCRSIPEFHITQALDQVSDLFEKHGGHQMAAGFTIQKDRVNELRNRLSEIARASFDGLELRPTLTADMDIELRRLPADILERLEILEPTGQGNPEVVFISRNLKVVHKKAVGREQKHLQLKLKDANKVYPAIAFNQGHLFPSLSDQIDVLYSLSRNEYNGYVSTQLIIADIKNVC